MPNDAGLRIRLRFSDCPELSELPWEYLYEREHNRFLCLSDRTPLVRYLEVTDSVRVVPVTPPLRILVVIASPSDLEQLNSEQEWSNVTTALSGLTQRGRVEVVRLAEPTLSALQRQLRRDTYHIFHFIGHGGFDPQTQAGMLAMEDDHGRYRLVGGDDLGIMLRDHRSLRLAVLNSCEGARGDRADPFSGTAQSLVQQGIPAVVAMQFEITDDAAITFGHVLYEAIADGYPLDAATTEARKAIYADGNLTEWGTPVLYLRAPDGHIFDIQDRPPPLLPPSAEEQPRQEVEEQARQEAEERARRDFTGPAQQAEEQARQETAKQAQQEAEARAQQEADARAQQEADARAQQEADARAQQEADARAQQEADARAQQEADARAQQEADARAQQEADARAQQEADARAQQEAEARAQQEAEERARRDFTGPAQQAEEQARQETEEQARQETRRKGQRTKVLVVSAVIVAAASAIGLLIQWEPTVTTGPDTSSPSSSAPSPPPTTTPVPPVWQKLKTRVQSFSLAGVAAHQNEVWAAGGMDADGKRDEVLVFNPQTKKWRPGSPLPQPISHAPLVSTGNKLYLLGGLATKDGISVPLATVYSLNTKNPGGTWVKDADLPAPRYGGAAAWDGQRLVFAGGAETYDPNKPRPAAPEIWELRSGKWERIDDVLQPARDRLAAATDGNGSIWFAGGAELSPPQPESAPVPKEIYRDVEVLRGNKVSDSTPIGTAIHSAAAVWTPDTGICVFGGTDGTVLPNQTARPVAKVQCLEGTDPRWPDLPEDRQNAGAAVIDNTVYVVGSRPCSPCLGGAGKGARHCLGVAVRLTQSSRPGPRTRRR